MEINRGRSQQSVLQLQLLDEIECRGGDTRCFLWLGRRWLFFVQRLDCVGESVFLVVAVVVGMEDLQGGLFELGRALLHLQQGLILRGTDTALDLLLQVHDFTLALAQLSLEGLIHRHDLLVVLLQLSVSVLLFPQLLIVETLLSDLCLYMGQFLGEFFQSPLFGLQHFFFFAYNSFQLIIFLHQKLTLPLQNFDAASLALYQLPQTQTLNSLFIIQRQPQPPLPIIPP